MKDQINTINKKRSVLDGRENGHALVRTADNNKKINFVPVLTAPTISETCETLVPEAAPR